MLGSADRRVAIELIDDFRNTAILREADRRVAELLAKPMYPNEAAEAIRADPSLDEEIRRVAIGLTQRYDIKRTP